MREEMLLRLKSGDTGALEQAMDEYAAYLFTVAKNTAPTALTDEDAEEIAADAFVRLWETRERLDPSRPVRGYLARIVKNLAVDRLRGKRLLWLPLEEDRAGSAETVGAGLEQRELEARLREYLLQLPARDRDILMRFYYYGQHTGDIAAALGMRHGALRTRLTRLRAGLRKKLEGDGYSAAEN